MMAERPFFSVFVTAYNRAEHIEHCVRSVLEQRFADFEVVVVDDGSTDSTPAVLAALADPRLRVIRHESNRGFYPARATGVEHSSGEWLVMLDSDWELLPYSLERLRTLIAECPPGVRIIRSLLECDDGSVQPGIMPSGTTGYHDRLRWMEAVTVSGAPSDAGHCIHRSVLKASNYFDDRRGDMSLLWETNLARNESSVWVPEILGRKRSDASNSLERDVRASRVIPRLLQEAPDALWMAQTMLKEHGDDLATHAPVLHRCFLERAALHAFLSGDRRAGLRHTQAALGSGASRVKLGGVAALGVVSPRALAYAKVLQRRADAMKAGAANHLDGRGKALSAQSAG